MRPLRALALAALTAAIVATGSLAPGTAASFTSAATVEANTVATSTLDAPTLTPGTSTPASITTSWTPAPTGGAPAEYTLTRTLADGTNPTEVYRGTATTHTDTGNIPAELDTKTLKQIAAGSNHSLALATDGTIWAWGSNASGQLGNGLTAWSVPTPVQVQALPGGRTAVSIAAGANHSVAVASDGTVWAWGNNASGQLGDGSTTFHATPVRASTGSRTVISVAAGSNHSLAVASDGTAWAWGHNPYGQLGTGSLADQMAPVQVQALPGGRAIVSVAAGSDHSVAVASDGTAWAWGYNAYGQLGNGSRATQLDPVQVQALPGDRTVASVAAGAYHSVAVASDGTVWAWGDSYFGQLGDGSTVRRSAPVQTSPGGRAVDSIAAGSNHSVAVASDGTAWAWGSNAFGQLGDGSTTSRSSPVLVQPIQALRCPTGLTLYQDSQECFLLAGAEYVYTVTTAIGGWRAISQPTKIATAPTG